MGFKSDIEIAQETTMLPIEEIAKTLGLGREELELYGNYKAKIDIHRLENKPMNGKLVLVTAITPTPAGEGKTTTVVGLGDALRRVGKKTIIALREPSLGPVFGVKGGAAGGGYAQVVPMEDINLHFTGDFHAIGAANNLIAAMLDNHIFHGNKLGIDCRKITWKRCMDMNDRQLRNITNGLGGKFNGVPREDGFDITVASEIMAVLCLSNDITELKDNLAKMIVGYTRDEEPVTVGQLNAHGAAAALLKEAIKPNLVQTLEHTPAIIHGGPFANIAHGCNSIIATQTALKLSDYVVTEAGFGGDLGAEKFIDIKCRKTGLRPSAVVIVATVKAIKMHGGVAKTDLGPKNLDALAAGMENLLKHIENITVHFGLPAVVAINRFPTDDIEELNLIEAKCTELKVNVALSEVFGKGSEGGIQLAKEVIRLVEGNDNSTFKFAYPDEASIKMKIDAVVKNIYGGSSVEFSTLANKEIEKLERLGFNKLPICMAKTQYSFSDDATRYGRPTDFKISIKNVKVSAGAGFIVVLTGDIMTMPGLPKIPAAEKIDIDENGNIQGLF